MGWAVVQLDYDGELRPLHGMYGSLEAEFEVQRKRTELTAFLCLLKKVVGSIKVHVDNEGIIDGQWSRERKCIDPKSGDADLWIKIWDRAAPFWSQKESRWKWSTLRQTAQR